MCGVYPPDADRLGSVCPLCPLSRALHALSTSARRSPPSFSLLGDIKVRAVETARQATPQTQHPTVFYLQSYHHANGTSLVPDGTCRTLLGFDGQSRPLPRWPGFLRDAVCRASTRYTGRQRESGSVHPMGRDMALDRLQDLRLG